MKLKKDSIDILVKLGQLIPFDDKLTLYHGRAKSYYESEEWRVKSDFNNAGNNTGNRNIQDIPVLYAGDKVDVSHFNVGYVLENGDILSSADEKLPYVNYLTSKIEILTKGKYILGDNKITFKSGDITGSLILELEERVVESI